jgi:hypothetical protein
MTDFTRSTLTKWGKRFFEARNQSDINESEEEEEPTLTQEESDLISELESEESLEYVGFGGNRICFSMPHTDEIVLFPRWGEKDNTLHNGKECNLNEAEIWTNIVQTGKRSEYNFLPIREYHDDGWWIIKPEITPITEDTEDVIEAWENGGKEELWDNVFGFNEYANMMDLTKANACLWDGEFTWFDYGTKPQD